MRNKFSDLINQGVAAFHHEPIAPEMPNSAVGDQISRLYNMYWGAATDTHMAVSQDGRRLVTGRVAQDPNKWGELLYSTSWGGFDWRQSGWYTLGDFLCANCLRDCPTVHNGERGIEIVPCEAGPCQCKCPNCVTTTESKIPQPINVLGDVGEIKEAFESAHSMKQLVENLNDNKWIAGDRWFVHENNVACTYETPRGLITYIMEVSTNRGNIIEDEEFLKLMKEEGLEALKLVQYDKYFKLESDDRKWSALLDKWKDNKITEKSFDVMSSADWVEHIKWMISALN